MFRLYIHVFHAFGIFNVFVSLFICVVMIICEFICFVSSCSLVSVYIYIHVICKHILLVWFSSFPSLKNSCSIQSYNFIIGFIDSKTSHPGPSSPHLAAWPPMCVKTSIQVPSRNLTHGFRPMWCRFQVLPELLRLQLDGWTGLFFKNERTIWGDSRFFLCCVFF